jgi:hypothetical protein
MMKCTREGEYSTKEQTASDAADAKRAGKKAASERNSEEERKEVRKAQLMLICGGADNLEAAHLCCSGLR